MDKNNKKRKVSKETVDVEGLQRIWNNSGPDVPLACEICSLLNNSTLYRELEIFLQNLPPGKEFKDNEIINRCRVYIAYHKKDFNQVYELLQENEYTETDDLVKIWDETHYLEEKDKRQKPLTPLSKFRIRQRYMPPKTICPTGERKKATLPKASTNLLRGWLGKHLHHPYPTRDNKKELVRQTGLTKSQVNTWFANARRRLHRGYTHTGHQTPRRHDHTLDTVVEEDVKSRSNRFIDAMATDRSLGNMSPGKSYDTASSSLAWPLTIPPNVCPWAQAGNVHGPLQQSVEHAKECGIPALYHALQQCWPPFLEEDNQRVKVEYLKAVEGGYQAMPRTSRQKRDDTCTTSTSFPNMVDDVRGSSSPAYDLETHPNTDAAQILVDLSNKFYPL